MISSNLARFFITRPLYSLAGKPTHLMPLSTVSTISPYIERNEKLRRPVSPHFLIYKWPITSLTSGSHRATGVLMSLTTYGLSVAIYVATGHSQEIVDFIQNLSLHPSLFMAMKALFVWPLCYHIVYGIRHAIWDTGYGFQKKTFLTAGMLVVFTSVGIALWIANLKPKCDTKVKKSSLLDLCKFQFTIKFMSTSSLLSYSSGDSKIDIVRNPWMSRDLIEIDNLVLKFLLDNDEDEIGKVLRPKSTFSLRMNHIRSRVSDTSCSLHSPDFYVLFDFKYSAAYRILNLIEIYFKETYLQDKQSRTLTRLAEYTLLPFQQLLGELDNLPTLGRLSSDIGEANANVKQFAMQISDNVEYFTDRFHRMTNEVSARLKHFQTLTEKFNVLKASKMTGELDFYHDCFDLMVEQMVCQQRRDVSREYLRAFRSNIYKEERQYSILVEEHERLVEQSKTLQTELKVANKNVADSNNRLERTRTYYSAQNSTKQINFHENQCCKQVWKYHEKLTELQELHKEINPFNIPQKQISTLAWKL
ncbi:hypothetical protein GJ496_012011 [Pomphorhynchus laevis]|nr:hypothetical protein GJ496_012011 [Pomphorhynchus laevis]